MFVDENVRGAGNPKRNHPCEHDICISANSKADLQDRIDELEAENDVLREQLDSIAESLRPTMSEKAFNECRCRVIGVVDYRLGSAGHSIPVRPGDVRAKASVIVSGL